MKASLTATMLFVVTLVLALGTSTARKHVVGKSDSASINKYIDSLDIGNTKLSEVIYSNYTAQGFVDGCGVFGFTNMVSAQHKQDFISAILIAELNSNKLFDRYSDSVRWYSNYIKVLGNLGLVMLSQAAWAPYKGYGDSFTIANAALDVLSPITTNSQLAVVKTSLNSLSNDASDRFKLWAEESTTDGAGNFQINLVDQSNETASIIVSGYQMVTTEYQWQFLWSNWKTSQITLQYMTTSFALSNSVWNSGVREQVYQKVAEQVDHYVVDLQF